MSYGLRREDRVEKRTKALLTWMDEHGDPMTCRGECVDVSTNGVRVLLTAKIPVGTVVQVQASDIGVHGSACVRTCQREKMDYIAGMEFVGGFQWKSGVSAPRCYD